MYVSWCFQTNKLLDVLNHHTIVASQTTPMWVVMNWDAWNSLSPDVQKIIDDMPTILRIASPDTINQVLSSFGRALSITHVSQPPAGLPQKEKTQFFRLEPTGTFWDAICASQAVAIFVPTEFKDLNFELFAI